MKILIWALVIAVLVVVALLAVVAARWGRRSYQQYSGLEHQRAAARQAREAGVDRLKDAERHLVEAQRELAGRGEYGHAQEIEHLRSQLSTLADRHRYATYGYVPLGSPHPVREEELARLQQHDADGIADAQAVAELAERIRGQARDGAAMDLRALEAALERLRAAAGRRKAVS